MGGCCGCINIKNKIIPCIVVSEDIRYEEIQDNKSEKVAKTYDNYPFLIQGGDKDKQIDDEKLLLIENDKLIIINEMTQLIHDKICDPIEEMIPEIIDKKMITPTRKREKKLITLSYCPIEQDKLKNKNIHNTANLKNNRNLDETMKSLKNNNLEIIS